MIIWVVLVLRNWISLTTAQITKPMAAVAAWPNDLQARNRVEKEIAKVAQSMTDVSPVSYGPCPMPRMESPTRMSGISGRNFPESFVRHAQLPCPLSPAARKMRLPNPLRNRAHRKSRSKGISFQAVGGVGI